MHESVLSDRLLSFVNQSSYRPMKPKRIARELGLGEEEYPELRKVLKNLIRLGTLQFGANHIVLPKALEKRVQGAFEGTFRSNRRGFGFVRPHSSSRAMQDDVFIPPGSTLSALDGDEVLVRMTKGRNGEDEGEVLQVLTRSKRRFAGTLDMNGMYPAVWLDGMDLEFPIQVGDVRGLPLSHDDKVIVEIVRFPEARTQGEGIILEVLGASRNPTIDLRSVILQFGLPESFPEQVLAEARGIADAFEETVPDGYQDLRDVLTLTIDPVDARDFDDAISLDRNEVGNWELLVHVADVSRYVPANSALDDEARERGTSVYLPGHVIPMLPEQISNFIASLQPSKVRMAKSVRLEFDDAGTPISFEVFNSAIQNDRRFSYEEVDAILQGKQEVVQRIPENLLQLLHRMDELAMTLRRRRMERGSIELNLPETKIDLDKSGKVKGAHVVYHTESHQIIEEFMLAANQAVATWLNDLELPFLRRVHPAPNSLRIQRLTQFVRDLGILCDDLESRFEIQRVVESVRGSTSEYAVNLAILKAMAKAVYQAAPESHFALDMENYCHFTSPIRRYPDLLVHRLVQSILEGKARPDSPTVLERLGIHCSDREQAAEAAERELIKVKLVHYANKRIGSNLNAVVIAVRPDGLVVRGTDIPLEAILSIRHLPHDRYRFDRHGQILEGFRAHNRFRLGDVLQVQIDRVDTLRREVHVLFVSKLRTATLPNIRPVKKRSSPKKRSTGAPNYRKRPSNKKKRRK